MKLSENWLKSHVKFSVDTEKLVDQLKKDKIDILGVEGEAESGWVLVDCGNIVINIMKKDERDFYDLEGLWGADALINKKN